MGYNYPKKIMYQCIALILIVCFILFSGCSTPRYAKIAFVWTSEHRLAPSERFLTVDASIKSTCDALKTWAKKNGGKLMKDMDTCSYMFRLEPDSEENFSIANGIARKHWASYDANKYVEWEQDEWDRMKDSTTEQVKAIEPKSESYLLGFKMGCREGTFVYPEQIGTRMTSSPKKVAYGPRTTSVSGAPTSMAVFANRTIEKSFCSLIRFFVFKDQGHTRVYAIGTPVDMSTSMTAAYGKTIEHRWWPQVSGKEEASLIKQAYTYLSGLDSTEELNNFGSNTSR